MLAGLEVILLVAIAVILAIGVVVGTTMLQGYLSPKYTRLEQGEPKKKVNYNPCCPPGLGCNDRPRMTSCRRALAYRLATPEEVHQLDMYWSLYSRDPSASALAAWENCRDTLIEDRVGHARSAVQHKALLGATETIEFIPDASHPDAD